VCDLSWGGKGLSRGENTCAPNDPQLEKHEDPRGISEFSGAKIYDWFLPLLRLDTVRKFVQLIKLVQQEVGMGNERVRPPRLPLAGAERDAALKLIRSALASTPFARRSGEKVPRSGG